jgi:PAP_fibrillin
VQVLGVLHGEWKLVYSNNAHMNGLISTLNRIPLVCVGDIYQSVDAVKTSVDNKMRVAVPYPIDLAISSSIELRTPQQARLTLRHASVNSRQQAIHVPQLHSVPSSIEIAGTVMDLTPLARLMKPLEDGLQNVQSLFDFAARPQVPADQTGLVTVLLTTYVDTTLRIARGADSSMFIFVRDSSLE